MEKEKILPSKSSKLNKVVLIILLTIIGLGILGGVGVTTFRLGKSRSETELTPTPSPTEEVSPSSTLQPEANYPLDETTTLTPTPTSIPTPTLMPTVTLTLTPAPKADLQILDFQFNHPPVKGESFTITFNLYNGGDVATGPFWWSWWSSWAKEVCRERIDDLDPHSGIMASCTYTYNGWSTYTTRAVVDVNDEVSESDETNNTYTEDVVPIH